MSVTYRVRFLLPAEVTVVLDARDEEDAADRAWEAAQEHLQTFRPEGTPSVLLSADLDGIGAESVEVAQPGGES